MNKITVGKRYHSKAGNTIEILQQVEVHDDAGRPTVRFIGKPVRAVSGHEDLLRKVHTFDGDGRWLNQNNLPVPKSIHDLHEECRDGA